MNLEQLFEEVLRESPSGKSTGGVLGQKAGQISLQQDKSIIELLEKATSEMSKNTEIIPAKYVIKNNKNKLIKISSIKDETEKQQSLYEWITEATNTFIDTIKTMRTISSEERQEIYNYFSNLANVQPRKGNQDWI